LKELYVRHVVMNNSYTQMVLARIVPWMNDAIVTDGVTCNQCEWNTEIDNVFCFKCYGDPTIHFAHFAINPTYDSLEDSRQGNLYCDNRYLGDLTVEGTCT